MQNNANSKRWNGIQVDGKPLSNYFKQQTEDQDKKTITNEIEKKKSKRRIYIREKHQPQKERPSKMTTLPQDKLNQTNLESNLKKAKSMKDEVIYYLLAGQKFTATEMQEHYEHRGQRIGRQAIWNQLSNLMRTDLSQFIERKKEVKNGIKQFRYWLNEDGVNLQPEGALELAKKYTHKKKAKKAPAKKKAVAKKKATRKPAKAGTLQTQVNVLNDNLDKLRNVVSEVMTAAGFGPDLSTPADINLNVTGKVDVVFTFKLGG